MKEFIIELLKNKLKKSYHYHSLEHILYVADKVVEIGEEENCTQDEIRLLVAAALWHDSGLINTYKEHETASCDLAKLHLPTFGYSASELEIICGMIMATKIPQSPKNKLEEILADADLEYLGTDHASKEANYLFEELLVINPTLTKKEWNELQISFLQKHNFFTKYAIEKKNPLKMEYLQSLINKQL